MEISIKFNKGDLELLQETIEYLLNNEGNTPFMVENRDKLQNMKDNISLVKQVR